MTKKVYSLFAFLVIAAMVLAACAPKATETPTEEAVAPVTPAETPAVEVGKGSVGIVLPTKNEPRWLQDEAQFQKALSEAGYDVEILFSEGDSAKEKSNVESLLTKGAKVIILTPQDGAAAAASADAARAAGAKMIAYDRLILGTDAVDYYVTFDSVAVGEQQGQFLVDNAQGSGLPLYLYAGAASDNNAFLFFEGAWNKLQPKIADGTFVIKNSSEAVALQDKAELTRDEMAKIIGQITTNWDFNTAKSLAESNLTAAGDADKGEVFILAPNDGTSRAIADAFAADPAVTKYYVTGQDAEKASVQYIIDGKQSMTVLKDVRVLVNDAIKAAIAYLEGGTPEQTTTYDNGAYAVPAKPSEVVTVTKDNVQAAIFDSGYWPAADFDLAGLTATEAPAAAGDCTSPDVLCVGLVTDVGEVDDKSFNQSAWEGVLRAESELGAQVKYVETKDAKDYGPNIELFAEEGYDIIVTVGFALGTATAEEAAKYPDIDFIGVDQFQAEPMPNVTGLIFSEDKSGFLAGALAAMMSTSNTVAGVYGTDLVPPVVAFKVGYENGAKYINPDINVISTFHPGGLDVAFTDPEWGATTAKQAIDQGADVIFGAGGKTGNGALIEVAGNEGLYCIGVDTDQWETVPEAHPCLISSAMKLITPGVFDLIKAASEGAFPSGNFVGPVGLAPFHDFDSVIPQDVKDKLIEIDAGLKDGSIPTGYAP